VLTLFRPTTGAVRGEPAVQTTNAVLHPWRKRALGAIRGQCPPVPPGAAAARRWGRWDGPPDRAVRDAHLPPIRVSVVLDTRHGHHPASLVRWCAARGLLLRPTPVGGSWLNLAEAGPRLIVRRAVAGQPPRRVPDRPAWCAATLRGGNAAPPPFEWGGTRAARRPRARTRCHRLGGSGGGTHRPIRRRPRPSEQWLPAWQLTH
jgi:hypothetical protein